LYSPPNINRVIRSRRIGLTVRVARNVYYRISVGIPEGKGPLRKLGHRWKNNIKTYLKEIGWKSLDLIRLS
jgi:hypothetical protein